MARYANGYSIAIFGLRAPSPLQPSVAPQLAYGQPRVVRSEDPFGMLCGGTGGLALPSSPRSVGSLVQRTVGLVRHRYILEFARPANGTAGLHGMEIAVTDPTAMVRASGVAFPVQDKALLSDPSAVPTDPGRAPLMGDRKILTQRPPH